MGIVSSKRLDTIQALRGIAALLVVLCHIRFFRVGSFGVDIFLCISGFIMMHVTEKGITNNFLLKRALRIIPMYWGITIATYALIVLKPQWINSSVALPKYLIKSQLFIPYERNGIVQPILGVGWTINYEIVFYIVFYICAKLSIRYRHYLCTTAITAAVLVGLCLNPPGIVAWFYTDAIMLEFVLGMFVYQLFKNFSAKNTYAMVFKIISVAMLLGMLIIGYYSCFVRPIDAHRFFLFGIPSAILLFCFVRGFADSAIPKSAIILGNISFSLYLIQYYSIFFFDRLIYPLDKLTFQSAGFCIGRNLLIYCRRVSCVEIY